MKKIALILGISGKIGFHSAQAFSAAGWQVRAYKRSNGNLVAAAQGASVIVNGLNPPMYHDWPRLIPAITRDVIQAAEASGATVIVPGNVYNFGAQGGIWSETTPQQPNTRKGKIRQEMEQAYKTSAARTIVLRAGNFIDPRRTDDIMTTLYLRALKSGKITLAGDPQVEQAYCYVPDWARAAVQLAEQHGQLEKFEDVPFPGHTFTALELKTALESLLQRPLSFTRFPWFLFKLTAPFWELAREMLEMRYLWNTPHRLSPHKLQRLLPDFEPTPLEAVLEHAVPPTLLRKNAQLRLSAA